MRAHNTVFDAMPQARPAFKEKALWSLVMGLFFFLVYGGSNEIAALTAPHPSFFWTWEKHLPFVPELIVPYMSSDIVFVLAFLAAPTRDALQRLALRNGLAIGISAAIFLAFPLAFSFERPDVTGWPAFLFQLLSVDKPYNQFPSLHVSLGFIAWHALTNRMRAVPKAITSIWFVLILLSTVLVYQHHAIDLIGGAAVAAFVFWLIPDTGGTRLPINFVSPRHLRIALSYLIGACIAAVVAFRCLPHAPVATALAAWTAGTLVLVAGSYAYGANGFLRKSRKGYSLLTWLLYGPYLVGSAVNWRYWRRKVPLMAEVAPGVWIGARPHWRDWAEIEAKRIGSVIDLAPELRSGPPSGMAHTHLPLLDVAIPDPAALDRIAQAIDGQIAKGRVFVHCALGMSRSVLAVCAWLMRNGHSADDAFAIVSRARPERVARPYMTIALNLYADFLRQRPRQRNAMVCAAGSSPAAEGAMP